MPTLADVVALVRELGPVAAVVAVLLYVQARQSAKMLDGLLGGLAEVRQAQADAATQQAAAVVELRGIRADLSRTESALQRLAERQADHGETITAHGVRLADHARRIERLEEAIPQAAPDRITRSADLD